MLYSPKINNMESKIDLIEDIFENIDLDHDSIDSVKIRKFDVLFGFYPSYKIYINFLGYPSPYFGEYLYNLIKLTESYCGVKFMSIYFPNIGHFINLDGSSWSERSDIREITHIKSNEPRYKNTFSIQNMTITFIE